MFIFSSTIFQFQVSCSYRSQDIFFTHTDTEGPIAETLKLSSGNIKTFYEHRKTNKLFSFFRKVKSQLSHNIIIRNVKFIKTSLIIAQQNILKFSTLLSKDKRALFLVISK